MSFINDGIVSFERLKVVEKCLGAFWSDDFTSVEYKEITATGIVYVCGHKCYAHRDTENGQYRITEPISGSFITRPKNKPWNTLSDAMSAIREEAIAQGVDHEKMWGMIQQSINTQQQKNGLPIGVLILLV